MTKSVVLVTGASGFIGSYLLPYLTALDYDIIALSRQPKAASHGVIWVTQLNQIQHTQIDYVINLAGESIGKGRWTPKRKALLLNSRVQTTMQLYEFLAVKKWVPKVMISGSAVGYYGIGSDTQWVEQCTEEMTPQPIFMSELCQQWEQAALGFQQNTKIMRLGVVFAKKGGIFPQMLLPIRLNLVNKIGSGKQPVAWVHIQDVLRTIQFLMQKNPAETVFNVVAPTHNSQAEFAQQAAVQWQKKPLVNVPSCIFQGLLGEQSQLILNGQYVIPQNLLEAGFHFKFANLKDVLIDLNHA